MASMKINGRSTMASEIQSAYSSVLPMKAVVKTGGPNSSYAPGI